MSASFIVIPHAHSHRVSLMSLLNVKFTPFLSLFSSPSVSSSRAPTSLPGRTRSWCQSPDAPARRSQRECAEILQQRQRCKRIVSCRKGAVVQDQRKGGKGQEKGGKCDIRVCWSCRKTGHIAENCVKGSWNRRLNVVEEGKRRHQRGRA